MEQENLKSMSVFTAVVNQEDEVESEYLSLYQEFDSHHNLITETNWSDEDTIETKITYSYDSSNKLSKEINYYEEDEINEQKSYFYTPEGKIEKIEIVYGDGSVSVQEFEYQPLKRAVTFKDEDGQTENREVRTYNEKGLLVEFCRYDGANNCELQIIHTYNEQDLLTVRRENNFKEEIASETRYTFDESGNQLSEVTISNRGNIMDSRTAEYDENGNVTEENINDYIIRYTYDENGRRLEREVTDPSGRVDVFNQYTYDELDRLTEERIYSVSRRDSMAVFKESYMLRRYEYERW